MDPHRSVKKRLNAWRDERKDNGGKLENLEKRGIRTRKERETDGGVAFYCLQSENGLSQLAGKARPRG